MPRGRMTGPVAGGRRDEGGLRKKKGWEGRAEESSVIWPLDAGLSVGNACGGFD